MSQITIHCPPDHGFLRKPRGSDSQEKTIRLQAQTSKDGECAKNDAVMQNVVQDFMRKKKMILQSKGQKTLGLPNA
jgi:hypothetical protein